jgi:hypothetical protein
MRRRFPGLKSFDGDFAMKMMRISFFAFLAMVLATPMLLAQDLSKYRQFTIGMSLPKVLERTEQKMAEVKVIHRRPALIQEVTWWPPNLPGTSFHSDTAREILFSFSNGELYMISVTYDQSALEGLTAEDIVQSISVKYGVQGKPTTEMSVATNDLQNAREKIIARWEDSQYSLSLHRSIFSSDYVLVISSLRLNATANEAIAKALTLEEQEGPQREAERQQKEADDLAAARLKNQKTFRP